MDTKLNQQKALYETIRQDRNQYSKKLVESYDENADLKRRFRLLQLQIQQLKEEITEKEKMLSTVKLEVNQKGKELTREIACARNQAQTLATQKNKIQELYN